eukprot:2816384-Pyramimonas_sp.AAC.1
MYNHKGSTSTGVGSPSLDQVIQGSKREMGQLMNDLEDLKSEISVQRHGPAQSSDAAPGQLDQRSTASPARNLFEQFATNTSTQDQTGALQNKPTQVVGDRNPEQEYSPAAWQKTHDVYQSATIYSAEESTRTSALEVGPDFDGEEDENNDTYDCLLYTSDAADDTPCVDL